MKFHKRNTRAAATLALALTAAGSACAQSSVTLFGVVDLALRRVVTPGVGSVNSMASGSYSSSRYGIRGAEDLGGGLSASFWLESFLSADEGTVVPPGFQRRSTLSLTSNDYGEIRLGRDYTPTHTNWARYDPFGYVGLGSVQLFSLAKAGNTPASSAFGTAPDTIQRANNGIQYILPRNRWNIEGAYVHNFGENGLAANDLHRSNGGRIGVSVGNLVVTASALNTKDDKIVNSAFKDRVLSGSYDAGVVRVSGGVRRFEYQSATQNNYLLGAIVPLGVQDIKFSWNRANWGGKVGTTSISNDRADQFAAGYVYHLSKRTHAYATVSAIRNKGNSRFVLSSSPAGRPGVSSRGFEMGVNHEF